MSCIRRWKEIPKGNVLNNCLEGMLQYGEPASRNVGEHILSIELTIFCVGRPAPCPAFVSMRAMIGFVCWLSAKLEQSVC